MNRFSLSRPLPLLAAAAAVAALLLPVSGIAQTTQVTQGAQTAQTAKPVASSAAAAPATGEGSVVTTSSGLIFKLVKQGTGPSPKASDTVKVHYRGTLLDGKEFDSSYSRGKPLEFPLNGVIKCWTEGVQRLQVGGSAKLTCPPAIAYGERGAGGVIPPNATLNFEVELLGIVGR